MTESSLPDYRKLFRATDLVPAAQPEWLAKGRIPRASICLLIGDEGIGKSLLWVVLVAHVTTGKPLFEFGIPAREPAHVILILTEDDWSTVVRPRLEVAGADLSMISVICTEDDGSGSPIFPTDMHLILDADPVPSLVVVDAWLDTVSSTLSVRDPQQARRALHPWKEAATETGATMLLLTHTNRTASANPRDKYGATGELRKKARMALYAQADDEEDGVLLVGPEKSNTTGKLPASRFRIMPVQVFEGTEDDDGTVPRLDLIGSSEKSIKEHIVDRFEASTGGGSAEGSTSGSKSGVEIDAWLTDFLAAGPQLATEIYSAADANGYSKDQAKRSKQRLNVEAFRYKVPGPWHWALPVVQESGKGAQERVSEHTLPYAPLSAPLVLDAQEITDCTRCGRPLYGNYAELGLTAHVECNPENFRSRCPIHDEPVGKSGKCIPCCLGEPAVTS